MQYYMHSLNPSLLGLMATHPSMGSMKMLIG